MQQTLQTQHERTAYTAVRAVIRWGDGNEDEGPMVLWLYPKWPESGYLRIVVRATAPFPACSVEIRKDGRDVLFAWEDGQTLYHTPGTWEARMEHLLQALEEVRA
jgi:hypothetical protein